MLPEASTSPGLYTDDEVQQGVIELFKYEKFVAGMKQFLPEELSSHILQVKENIGSSFEFQRDIVHPLLQLLIKTSMTQLTASNLSALDANEKYLFISNHRDIGLDSAFLNLLLFDNDFSTTQIAIGDNLIKHRVAELIFRINKSFVVQRSGNPRDLYKASQNLSKYIHTTVAEKKDSVWIAQREGRAKDGNDQTQVSLLKMLAMAAERGKMGDHFNSMKIVPVAISYEYNPCDYLLTKEYIDKSENPDFVKSFEDDMKSILQGLKGQKGAVNISFGTPIALGEEERALGNKELLQSLAQKIDQQIHSKYQLSAINYLAYDRLHATNRYATFYQDHDPASLDAYFEERIGLFEAGQQEKARNYLLGMYAKPVENQAI